MSSHELLSQPDDIARVAVLLKKESVIAFDTEFIRENTFYPVFEILQIATRDQVWLIDAAAFKKGFVHGPESGYHSGLDPLREVFEDPKILKIAHASPSDQECLYTSFGFFAAPCLDTAVAASLLGLGDGIGLAKLLKTYLGVEIKKGHARTDWTRRPLARELLEYAASDVEHLVELGEGLLRDLKDIGRADWALKLCEAFVDPKAYNPGIEELTDRFARGGKLDPESRGVLIELMGWREKRVRELNLPRRWVAEDSVLVDIAKVKPKSREHLESFRGLNKGEIKKSGDKILQAVERGREEARKNKDAARTKRPPRPEIPTGEEHQVMELLKCYVGILADETKIASRYILTSSELFNFIRALEHHRIQNPEDLIREGVLSVEAAKLVGDELIAFVRGKRALSVEDGKIKIVKI